jgi:hypothetical protein
MSPEPLTMPGDGPAADGVEPVVDRDALAEEPAHRLRLPLGAAALALAALCLLADAIAVAAAAAGHWGLGTAIADAVMVVSLVPFALGIVAIVFRLGRGFATAAVAVSVLAHPLVLTGLLAFLHG